MVYRDHSCRTHVGSWRWNLRTHIKWVTYQLYHSFSARTFFNILKNIQRFSSLPFFYLWTELFRFIRTSFLLSCLVVMFFILTFKYVPMIGATDLMWLMCHKRRGGGVMAISLEFLHHLPKFAMKSMPTPYKTTVESLR